jgi:hypothetical protein
VWSQFKKVWLAARFWFIVKTDTDHNRTQIFRIYADFARLSVKSVQSVFYC